MLACTSRPQFSLSAMNATEVTLSISTHSDHICFPLGSLKKIWLEGISGGHAVLVSCLMQSKTSKKLDQVAQGLVQPICKNFQKDFTASVGTCSSANERGKISALNQPAILAVFLAQLTQTVFTPIIWYL